MLHLGRLLRPKGEDSPSWGLKQVVAGLNSERSSPALAGAPWVVGLGCYHRKPVSMPASSPKEALAA